MQYLFNHRGHRVTFKIIKSDEFVRSQDLPHKSHGAHRQKLLKNIYSVATKTFYEPVNYDSYPVFSAISVVNPV